MKNNYNIKWLRKYSGIFLTVLISLFVIPADAQWLSQFAASYNNRGTITPTATAQTNSNTYTTSYYRYPYWTLNATAGVTYYFDLCNSSGGSLSATRLILHDGSYGTFNTGSPTEVIENVANGCAGAGAGYSKIIWTCLTTGTYYLESAASGNATFWGVVATQTNVLRYYTLPSSATVCTDNFYDKGNSGTDGSFYNYNNNEDWVYTYFPATPGNSIEVTFSSFDTQSGSDLLRIYNGNSIAAPQFPGSPFSGTTVPGTFTSTATDGSITFRYTTGNTTISTGWDAAVSCISNCASFPTVSVTGLNNFCAGDSTALTANASSVNGPITSYQWQLNSTNIVGATSSGYYATSAGTYTVIVTDIGGCSSSSTSIAVTVSPLPTAGFTFNTSGPSATFTNTSQDGISYSWDFGDGSPLDNSANPSHTYTADGTYTVTLTVTNGCGTDTYTLQVIILGTGMNEALTTSGLLVYPNPVGDILNIVASVQDGNSVLLKIFNAYGQLVFSENKVDAGKVYQRSVDVSGYAPGYYQLQMITDKTIVNSRLIIN